LPALEQGQAVDVILLLGIKELAHEEKSAQAAKSGI
jgi:hypothetical protein